MRRKLLPFCFCAFLLLAGSSTVYAQGEASNNAEEQANEKWHVVNSAIFAVILGYALWKYAPAFFSARSADIQKAIQEATGLKMQADLRYSEIDRKMATLGEEVKRMRQQSQLEMEREHERRKQETEGELQHIQRSLEAEVQAFRAEASSQIRLQTAQRALALAERRLRDTTPSSANEGLFKDVIRLVERSNQ